MPTLLTFLQQTRVCDTCYSAAVDGNGLSSKSFPARISPARFFAAAAAPVSEQYNYLQIVARNGGPEEDWRGSEI